MKVGHLSGNELIHVVAFFCLDAPRSRAGAASAACGSASLKSELLHFASYWCWLISSPLLVASFSNRLSCGTGSLCSGLP